MDRFCARLKVKLLLLQKQIFRGLIPYLPARKGEADELSVKHTRQQPDSRYAGKSFRPKALFRTPGRPAPSLGQSFAPQGNPLQNKPVKSRVSAPAGPPRHAN